MKTVTLMQHGFRARRVVVADASGCLLVALVVLAASFALLMGVGAADAHGAVSSKLIGPGQASSIATSQWVSGDGRYMVFQDSTGLIEADTLSGTRQFVDRTLGYPSVSSDGDRVAYLVGSEARVWSRQTGTSELVSLTDDDKPADASPYGVTISGDGRYVAFLSDDPDLAPPGWDPSTMGTAVFLRDTVAGTTTALNVGSGGAASNSFIAPSLSADGSVAVWVGRLPRGTGDVGLVIWERATGAPRSIPNTPAGGDWAPMVSGDGRKVVWTGSDPVSGDHGMFVSDVATGGLERQGDGYGAAISHDGRYVSYADTSSPGQVFRLDRLTGARVPVSFDPAGNPLLTEGKLTGISGDGKKVAFVHSGPSDPNQVYLATITDDPPPPTVLDPPAPEKDAVWAWGYGGREWLGDPLVHPFVMEVPGASDAIGVSAGRAFALVLRRDGTVWSWGNNTNAQLGIGTSILVSPPPPVRVTGLTNVVAVAAGEYHGLALKSDGSVFAWGANASGQLGDGTTVTRFRPVRVASLDDVIAVAANYGHSLAVKRDGTVWAWGQNQEGELGNGTHASSATPVRVSGLTGVTQIAAGPQHSLALKSDGTVWSWGNNPNGELGDGTTTQRSTPVRVQGLNGVTSIAAGTTSLAATTDGAAWSWGPNSNGQLGNGTVGGAPRLVPGRVNGLSGVTSVSAGSGATNYAILSDGTAWAWGLGARGMLGDGTFSLDRSQPTPVRGLSAVRAIGSGGSADNAVALGRASPTVGQESFSTSLPAGGSATTDVEGDGATPADAIETTVSTPVAGTVSVHETGSAGSGPGSYSLDPGWLVQITAPTASAANPLVLTFRLDDSTYPSNLPNVPSVLRNGVPVAACTSAAGASPDPCIASSKRLPDNDLEVVVRTSAASQWAIGQPAPVARTGGPYRVFEGSTVTLRSRSTGGSTPLQYRWLGVTSGRLRATARVDGVDDTLLPVRLVVSDRFGITSADNTTVRVRNRPPTVRSLKVTRRRPRRVLLSARFTDPGRLDTHTARIYWGDGSTTKAKMREHGGRGALHATHRYSRVRRFKVRVRLRDDDGGTTNRHVHVRL